MNAIWCLISWTSSIHFAFRKTKLIFKHFEVENAWVFHFGNFWPMKRKLYTFPWSIKGSFTVISNANFSDCISFFFFRFLCFFCTLRNCWIIAQRIIFSGEKCLNYAWLHVAFYPFQSHANAISRQSHTPTHNAIELKPNERKKKNNKNE